MRSTPHIAGDKDHVFSATIYYSKIILRPAVSMIRKAGQKDNEQ